MEIVKNWKIKEGMTVLVLRQGLFENGYQDILGGLTIGKEV